MRIGISFLQNHQLNGAWWLLSLFLQPCLEILIECSGPSVKTTSRVNIGIGNQDAVWKAINRSIVVTHYLYVQARNGKEKFTSKDVEMLHWKLKHRIVNGVYWKTHWAIAALEKYIKSNKILKKPKRKSKISLQYIKQMFT